MAAQSKSAFFPCRRHQRASTILEPSLVAGTDWLWLSLCLIPRNEGSSPQPCPGLHSLCLQCGARHLARWRLTLQCELNGCRYQESQLGATEACHCASLMFTSGQDVLKDIQLPGMEAERESTTYWLLASLLAWEREARIHVAT